MHSTSATAREIASQPDVWRRAVAEADGFGAMIRARGERALVIGCGTSAFVASSIAALRESAGFGETDWAFAAEAPLHRRYDRVIALTRSATTTEIVDALDDVPEGTYKVVIAAVAGEMPATSRADEAIIFDYADEESVVQTRFPTTVLAGVRAAFGEDLSAAVSQCERIAVAALPISVGDFDHFVFLGSGWTIGLAHEAALKIRESAQAWSESGPAMDYRHGPIAVASARTLVYLLGPAPAGLVSAVHATGATVLDTDLDPLVQLVLAQRIALELAVHRGLNPDQPRALTRSVVLATATPGG